MKWVVATVILAVNAFANEQKVLALAGSTRDQSFNKILIQEAAALAREMGAQVTVVDLKDYPMPFYDADLEKSQGMPSNAKKLKNLMMKSDVILIASPEYNGSMPAVLKNAIDWTTRSEDGQGSLDAYKGKKFAIMSASPGQGGGVRGLTHLRQVLEAVQAIVIPRQVTVPTAHVVMNAEKLTRDSVKKELKEEISTLFLK